MPNQDQVMGALRILLMAVITWALTQASNKGWIGSGEVAILSGALVTLALSGWSILANRLSSHAQSVTDAGGTVIVPHSATAELKAIAADPSAPNVVRAEESHQ